MGGKDIVMSSSIQRRMSRGKHVPLQNVSKYISKTVSAVRYDKNCIMAAVLNHNLSPLTNALFYITKMQCNTFEMRVLQQ